MSTGGSIQEVTIKGRPFAVASDQSTNRSLGGFSNEVQMNGNGTTRSVKSRLPWKVDGLALSIDDSQGDQEWLQDVANGDDVPISIKYASGVVYQGTGNITDELVTDSQNTTASVALSGPGSLTQQP